MAGLSTGPIRPVIPSVILVEVTWTVVDASTVHAPTRPLGPIATVLNTVGHRYAAVAANTAWAGCLVLLVNVLLTASRAIRTLRVWRAPAA